MIAKYRWFFFALITLGVAAGGLWLGKSKEGDYMSRLYARQDFTLLDDQNEFFQLSKFPSSRLLLLIFTPDSLHPDLVKPFREFAKTLREFQGLGIDIHMITRTIREIARNFKEAARFNGRLLLDNSGTVGRNIGVWPDNNPVGTWAYALMDNKLQVYWAEAYGQPLTFKELMAELKRISAEAHGKAPKP